MTTTPDNHQTPEQAYDRWRNHRINRELAGAIGDYAAALASSGQDAQAGGA